MASSGRGSGGCRSPKLRGCQSGVNKSGSHRTHRWREPTTDGRELMLSRYTEPEPELNLLLKKLKLELPAQPPPKITAATAPPSPL